jgi:hypothetical protein
MVISIHAFNTRSVNSPRAQSQHDPAPVSSIDACAGALESHCGDHTT